MCDKVNTEGEGSERDVTKGHFELTNLREHDIMTEPLLRDY